MTSLSLSDTDAATEALIAQMVADDFDDYDELSYAANTRPIGASYHDYENPMTSYERQCLDADPNDDGLGWAGEVNPAEAPQIDQSWDPEAEPPAFDDNEVRDGNALPENGSRQQSASASDGPLSDISTPASPPGDHSTQLDSTEVGSEVQAEINGPTEPSANMDRLTSGASSSSTEDESLSVTDPDDGGSTPRASGSKGKGKETIVDDNSSDGQREDSECVNEEHELDNDASFDTAAAGTHVPGGINGIWRGRRRGRDREDRESASWRRGRRHWDPTRGHEDDPFSGVKYEEDFDEQSGIMYVNFRDLSSKDQQEQQRREELEVVEIRLDDDEDFFAAMDRLRFGDGAVGKGVVC